MFVIKGGHQSKRVNTLLWLLFPLCQTKGAKGEVFCILPGAENVFDFAEIRVTMLIHHNSWNSSDHVDWPWFMKKTQILRCNYTFGINPFNLISIITYCIFDLSNVIRNCINIYVYLEVHFLSSANYCSDCK